MFKKFIILLVTISIVMLIPSGCAKENKKQKIVLVLDWTPNTNHTGIFVAKELGYYEAEGFDIEIVQPPEGGALSLVAAGKADFAVSFEEEVLIAANAETPLPIVAIAGLVEHNTGGIISLKEKGITRFKDMEGKTYGSWEMPIYDEIIRDCIKADGGDPSKVTFVPNSATDSINGLKRDFDTVWVYEGWDKLIADARGVETNFLLFRDINPVFDYYTPVLITNNDTLHNKKELVKKFLKATEKGYIYTKENPSKAADILIKNAPETDKDIIYASQEHLSTQYFSEKWGYIDEERWNAFFDWMKKKNLVSQNADNGAFENVK